MKFLVADECNVVKEDKFGFFMYGGIVISDDEMRPLSQGFQEIKRELGINKKRPIKWTNNGWQGEEPFGTDLHKKAKDKILTLFAESGSKIIVSLSPQDFYHNVSFIGLKIKSKINIEAYKRSQEYALNTTLKKFNRYLRETDDMGLVLTDTFSDDTRLHMTNHCAEIFPNGNGRFTLEKIAYPVIPINNEYSHLHQINDVVLGAIQYSLRELGYNSLPRIKERFWKDVSGNDATIYGRGFDIYPKNNNDPALEEKIEKLVQKFSRLIAVNIEI